jgi:hypothetical protein
MLDTHNIPKNEGIPTESITPQKTNKFVISLDTENNGKSEQRIPIVDFAESIKFYPVTAIHITLKLLRIFNNASIYLNIHETIHKQTATAIFLLFLLFESTTIRTNVTIEITRAANVIDPNEDLTNHPYAVIIGFLSFIS